MNQIISGVAAPLPYSNLDTDQIMPKQFLRIIDKAGLDRGLLYDLRFDADGAPRPDCVLNQPAYAGAAVLVAGPNFGCGSSREHAVWGLMQYGIRAVVAASFGEIFYFNALNNGLLLVSLPPADVDALLARVSDPAGNRVEIDALAGTVRAAGAGISTCRRGTAACFRRGRTWWVPRYSNWRMWNTSRPATGPGIPG